jgi:hypothetical protein
MIFRPRKGPDAATAVADARPDRPASSGAGTPDELFEEIDALSSKNRADRDLDIDRRVLRLRHRAGAQLVGRPGTPEYPAPASGLLPNPPGLPEFGSGEVTPELLRAAILRDGCLLVRGLLDSDEATAIAQGIDRSFAAREAVQSGASAPAGYYEEFKPASPFGEIAERPWVQEGGGVLAVDSPKVAFDMVDAFERAGLRGLVGGYLGERPAISAQKCTLRKAEPSVPGAWHQDGAFLGAVRALNLWVSLSRCGDAAPGLDIVPRRIDHLVPAGTEDTVFSIQVSTARVEEAARGVGIMRPIFEPGDAIFFDELFLHQTASDPKMPNPRFAIESWFFGPSAFPPDYVPLAF